MFHAFKRSETKKYLFKLKNICIAFPTDLKNKYRFSTRVLVRNKSAFAASINSTSHITEQWHV